VVDKLPESMTLEYKAEQDFGPKERLEIAKDVSAFANASGGVIIYGVPCEPESRGHGDRIIPMSQYGINPMQDFESFLENALYETVVSYLPDLCIKKVPVAEQPDRVPPSLKATFPT